MSVVVVLTVVKIKGASGVWVLIHGIGVDLETEGGLDGMKERHAIVLKVGMHSEGKSRPRFVKFS